MDAKTLRELVQSLGKLSAENRAFIAAWAGTPNAASELLAASKKKITDQFFTRGKPRFATGRELTACRRLIKDYRKATSTPNTPGGFDIPGTLDLGLHYLTTCTRSITEIGGDDATPYESMRPVVEELARIIADAPTHAEDLLPTVRTLSEMPQNFGYGFGDDTRFLEEAFETAAARANETSGTHGPAASKRSAR